MVRVQVATVDLSSLSTGKKRPDNDSLIMATAAAVTNGNTGDKPDLLGKFLLESESAIVSGYKTASDLTQMVMTPGVQSVAICDEKGENLLGATAVIRHDRNLAYFCYLQLKSKLFSGNQLIAPGKVDLQIFNGHTAEISDKQRPSVYSCRPGEPVKMAPSQIPNEQLHRGQVAQPLVDHMKELIERQVFGLVDIDRERNFTVDLPRHSPHYLYFCGQLGFPVIDTNEFDQYEIATDQLVAIANEPAGDLAGVSVCKFTDADGLMLENFDAFVAGARRSLYLRNLVKKDGVECRFLRNAKGRCGGFIVFDSAKIHCLYASELAFAKLLLKQLTGGHRSLFVVRGGQLDRLISQSGAKKLQSVRRLHSIFAPQNIKWEDIYVPNVGVHLV